MKFKFEEYSNKNIFGLNFEFKLEVIYTLSDDNHVDIEDICMYMDGELLKQGDVKVFCEHVRAVYEHDLYIMAADKLIDQRKEDIDNLRYDQRKRG
jgi:hypothetical protein